MDSIAPVQEQPKRNPLLPAFVGALVLVYFDSRFYFFEHRYIALGLVIVIPTIVFIILFLMRSRFAWHAALLVVFMIASTLFLTYQRGYMGFSFDWLLGIVDLFLFGMFLLYLWKVRGSYLRYIAREDASLSR